MKPNAYTQPPPFTWDPVELRRILPIYPPPEPLDYPPLPSPPRKPSFGGWTLSTHLFPACYLRTTRPAPEPLIPPPHLSKDERRRLLEQARQELKELQTSRVTDGYPQVLWNCVNRYVRTDLGERECTGLTLSFYHANGFPKEVRVDICYGRVCPLMKYDKIFEPTLEDLFNSAAATLVDEVWVWEAVQHGDAALVNAPFASGICESSNPFA